MCTLTLLFILYHNQLKTREYSRPSAMLFSFNNNITVTELFQGLDFDRR